LIAVTLSVALGALAAPAWAAPEGNPEPVEARLQIDTSEAGGGADVLHRRIEERANIVLREAKVLPGSSDDVAIEITVRELRGDEPGYAVTFELRDADGRGLDKPAKVDCSLCTETELVARVESELATVVGNLRELEAKPEATSSDPSTIDPQLEPPAPDPTPPPTRAGMLAGGITLVVVGTASLGTGVGLAVPEPRVDEDNPLDLITTRPVGYALLAGGFVVAATGAVLTAIAIKHRRQARWSIAPVVDRTRAGLVLGWRFG
jgi:hypothetical protein